MRTFLVIVGMLATGCGTVGLVPSDTGAPTSTIEIDPYGQIDFGAHSINAAKSARMDITLFVQGESPVGILDIVLDGSDADLFVLPPELPLPMRLQPGIDFPLSLRFSPEEVGSFLGEFKVIIDDGTPDGALIHRPIMGDGCEADGW